MSLVNDRIYIAVRQRDSSFAWTARYKTKTNDGQILIFEDLGAFKSHTGKPMRYVISANAKEYRFVPTMSKNVLETFPTAWLVGQRIVVEDALGDLLAVTAVATNDSWILELSHTPKTQEVYMPLDKTRAAQAPPIIRDMCIAWAYSLS